MKRKVSIILSAFLVILMLVISVFTGLPAFAGEIGPPAFAADSIAVDTIPAFSVTAVSTDQTDSIAASATPLLLESWVSGIGRNANYDALFTAARAGPSEFTFEDVLVLNSAAMAPADTLLIFIDLVAVFLPLKFPMAAADCFYGRNSPGAENRLMLAAGFISGLAAGT